MKTIAAEYTPEMVHDAVSRGADWLYERCPDWLQEIDLAKLDLASKTHCTLGQTAECLTNQTGEYNRFALVLNHFNKGPEWAIRLGFEVPQQHPYNSGTCTDDCHREMQARYEMLTTAWREYVRARIEEAVPA